MTLHYKDFRVIITESVLRALSKFKQTGRKNEQGGILLGTVSDDIIEINRISIPTMFDKSSRHGFIRDKKSAQLFVDYEFENSNGKIIYLGEWHTHPENYPTPSYQDKNMITKQFKDNILNEPFLLLFIVGIKKNYYSIYDGKRLNLLKTVHM